jgi:hypothetical protein
MYFETVNPLYFVRSALGAAVSDVCDCAAAIALDAAAGPHIMIISIITTTTPPPPPPPPPQNKNQKQKKQKFKN